MQRVNACLYYHFLRQSPSVRITRRCKKRVNAEVPSPGPPSNTLTCMWPIMNYGNYSTVSGASLYSSYFVRPRKEESRVQSPKKLNKKEGKESRTHSFARILFLLGSDAPHSLTSSTGLLAAYRTVLCPRKEGRCNHKKRKN